MQHIGERVLASPALAKERRDYHSSQVQVPVVANYLVPPKQAARGNECCQSFNAMFCKRALRVNEFCAPQAGEPIHWSFWLVQYVTMAKAECQATCFGKPSCMGASAFVQVPVMVTGARREGLAAL